MGRILTVTANPSVDRTELVPGFQLGHIHRPQQVINLPGGKALNVARVIHTLGGETMVCTRLAGYNGIWMMEQLEKEGIDARATWSKGETRYSISIYDPLNGLLTELYENSNPVDEEEWVDFAALVEDALQGATYVAFSSALPVGAPEDGYCPLIEAARRNNVIPLLDTHGASLKCALPAKPYMVKVNGDEAGEVTGLMVNDPQQAVQAAHAIRRYGIEKVIITLGKAGAVAVDENAAWSASLPAVKSISAVGSGDAFLGGLAFAFDRGESFEAALKLATAAGAANTLVLGAGRLDKAMTYDLAREVKLEKLG